MHYTSSNQGTPLNDLASNQPGKHKGNTSKAIKANSLKDKGLGKPCSTPPPHQSHGTINQSQWTLTEPEHQEETGKGKEKVHQEETWPEQKMLKSKDGYKVHVSTVENKDTLLTIAPQSRNAPTHAQPSLLTGAQKIMKATREQPLLILSTNN